MLSTSREAGQENLANEIHLKKGYAGNYKWLQNGWEPETR